MPIFLKQRRTMDIEISRGTGEGPTPLAAFDAALCAAGVGDYNLIILSSVIPPGSRIVISRHDPCVDDYGCRLYVVLSRADVEKPGESAWAGLGWTQGADGRGLFVEEHGESEPGVRETIRVSLGAMIAVRGGFGPICDEIAGVACHDAPACAVVVAVYCSAAWGDQ